eukprot:5118497-Pleurochrysis_carterae.AAC.2
MDSIVGPAEPAEPATVMAPCCATALEEAGARTYLLATDVVFMKSTSMKRSPSDIFTSLLAMASRPAMQSHPRRARRCIAAINGAQRWVVRTVAPAVLSCADAPTRARRGGRAALPEESAATGLAEHASTQVEGIVTALAALSEWYGENSLAARRGLRSTVEHRGLDLNKRLLDACASLQVRHPPAGWHVSGIGSNE